MKCERKDEVLLIVALAFILHASSLVVTRLAAASHFLP